MSTPTEYELKEFANALQISIRSKIMHILTAPNTLIIKFDKNSKTDDDEKLLSIIRLFKGQWNKEKNEFVIQDIDKENWPKITLFLHLTRMNPENITWLAEVDSSINELAERLGLIPLDTKADSVKKCMQIIFNKMKQKNITIRELSEKSGLTQVAISNFKKGGDIRLSNFLNIAKTLGTSIRIK